MFKLLRPSGDSIWFREPPPAPGEAAYNRASHVGQRAKFARSGPEKAPKTAPGVSATASEARGLRKSARRGSKAGAPRDFGNVQCVSMIDS
jgi:hypothetical protein